MSKKYLDTVGLNKLVANILSKFAAKNHSHSNATTNSAGFMSSSDKVKLDGVSTGANRTIVDSTLSSTSVNAIQNKAVKAALDGKAASSHTHPTAQITGLDAALSGKASASHKHDAGDITSGILPIGRGGTGGTTAKSAQHNMLADMNEVTDGVNDNTTVLSSYISSSVSTGSVYKRKLSTLWPWIKSKTDPLYATRTHNHDSAYAAKIHNHDAGNITSGTLPIGRGGTGAGTADAALKNLMDNCTVGGTAAPSDDLWYFTANLDAAQPPVKRKHSALWSYIKSKTDPLYQPRGSYAASSHTHSISNITNLQSQLDSKQPKGSYAASSHTHTISNVTNLQTELDKKQVKIQPVTTAGTGSAYTATVPHIKALTAGMKFTMVPHVVSADVSPTLNVNNLGAKAIRQRLSNGTVSTATGATANWLAAGKPVDVMYDGQFWVVDFVRPNMASAYGVLPVVNGGTGANTAEQARQNLGITPSNIGAANAVQLVKIESMLKCADIEGLTQYTTNSAFTMGVSNPSISGIGCYAKFYCTLYVMPPSTTSFPKGTVIGHFRIKGIYNHIIVENNNSNFATIANPSCDDASTDIQVVLNKPWSPGGSYGSSAINATLCYK